MLFTGDSSDSSEVYLKRMLQILAEFSTDQILSKYVIDDVWEYMDAMKVRFLTPYSFFWFWGGARGRGDWRVWQVKVQKIIETRFLFAITFFLLQDWKHIISMLLNENSSSELRDVDATSLIRLFCSSVKKAVGERIVPATDNRKQYHNKAQRVSLLQKSIKLKSENFYCMIFYQSSSFSA